jgi:hypothetical protein
MGYTAVSFDTDVVETFRSLRLEVNYKTQRTITNSDLLRHACKLIRKDIDTHEKIEVEVSQKEITEIN